MWLQPVFLSHWSQSRFQSAGLLLLPPAVSLNISVHALCFIFVTLHCSSSAFFTQTDSLPQSYTKFVRIKSFSLSVFIGGETVTSYIHGFMAVCSSFPISSSEQATEVMATSSKTWRSILYYYFVKKWRNAYLSGRVIIFLFEIQIHYDETISSPQFGSLIQFGNSKLVFSFLELSIDLILKNR